jgi:RimJ/RimL family protein N-acetyltransferase
MDEGSARDVLSWRYDAPYDIYNCDPNPEVIEAGALFLADPANNYYTISDKEGQVVGFCVFGLDAQVPGGDYGSDALDIGLGIRPDLTGRGQGNRYVTSVLDFAQGLLAPKAYRVTVAEFNRRALRVWQKAGFRPIQTFAAQGSGQVFVVLMIEVRRTTESASHLS